MEPVLVIKAAFAAYAVAACTYNVDFRDCAINCATAGCPEGLTCGTEGLCRVSGATETCAAMLGDAGSGSSFPSCTGLAATCGPNSNDDCCSTAMPIPGGMYYRSYDVATDSMYPDMSYPATVSPFVLDKYEVTVGRFRAFVNAGMGTQASPPPTGAGARTLNGLAAQGGWDPSWNSSLSANTATLETNLSSCSYETWTAAAGGNENLPIDCVSWYDAMTFCVWDGGFLPTEAQWNFAAAGGSEQRAYPWSSPPGSLSIDCSYANYDINVPSGTYCVGGTTGALNRVGGESPKGDGKWGQSDLAGNVWEWVLDWDASPYAMTTCDDCANLTPATGKNIRGGSILYGPTYQRVATRKALVPAGLYLDVGVRCARAMP